MYCRTTDFKTPLHHVRAFTLLEVLTVIAIMGILASLSAPSMSAFLDRARLTSTSNELVSSLRMARSEAIKRGLPVVLCSSQEPSLAIPVCTPSTYGKGWFVFVDQNRNGASDSGEFVIRQVAADVGKVTIEPDTAAASRIRFNAIGANVTDSGVPINAVMELSLPTNVGLRITVEPSGRLSTTAL